MLYSTVVYFYAIDDIIFRTYETESLHGLLFNVLAKSQPKFASDLHESIIKLFTLSNLTPFTQRQDVGKVLKKGKEYKFRVTFLDENIFQTFMDYFIQTSENLRLNGVPIHIIKILTTSSTEPWCGQTTFEELLSGEAKKQVTIQFLTTTSFRHGERNVFLPTPELVFGSLLLRWQNAHGLQLSLTEEDFSNIEINQYELKTRREKFSDYSVKGFTGECEYWFGNLSVQKRKEIMALAHFAFYAGIGYKTTMGLGQVRIS